ncbi:hypothetical protein BC940DRAFT_303218 [Gongronella butleri]|nr:hypothetical protein BC940DRAFT_303218 [Gongronella butleri]
MDRLPLELLPYILRFLPRQDLVRNARVVNHRWSWVAGLLVFDQIVVDLNTLGSMSTLVEMVVVDPKVLIPLKHVKLCSNWIASEFAIRSGNRHCISMRAGLKLVEFVLPHLPDLRSVDISLPHDLKTLDTAQLDILHQITRNCKLVMLRFQRMPVFMSQQITSHLAPSLRILEISHTVADNDLQLVLLLLRKVPGLEKLMISLDCSQVNGEPLRTFLYSSLSKEPQYYGMRSMKIQAADNTKRLDHLGILAFFYYVTPRLYELSIIWLMHAFGKKEALDSARLPALHDDGFPISVNIGPEHLGTDHTVCKMRRPDLYMKSLKPRHNELLFCAEMSIISPILAQLPLSQMDHLSIRTRYVEFRHPLDLSDLVRRSPKLEQLHLLRVKVVLSTLDHAPWLAQIKTLQLWSCLFENPAELDCILAQCPSLQVVRLGDVRCKTWLWHPVVKLENPLVDVLSSFYARHQRPDRFLRWLSLPVHLDELDFTDNTNGGSVEPPVPQVYIFLQSSAHTIGPSVQVVFRGRLDDSHPIKDHYLEGQDLITFATGLEEQAALLAAGSQANLPDPPWSKVDKALHVLCCQFNATVYACSSIKKCEILRIY